MRPYVADVFLTELDRDVEDLKIAAANHHVRVTGNLGRLSFVFTTTNEGEFMAYFTGVSSSPTKKFATPAEAASALSNELTDIRDSLMCLRPRGGAQACDEL